MTAIDDEVIGTIFTLVAECLEISIAKTNDSSCSVASELALVIVKHYMPYLVAPQTIRTKAQEGDVLNCLKYSLEIIKWLNPGDMNYLGYFTHDAHYADLRRITDFITCLDSSTGRDPYVEVFGLPENTKTDIIRDMSARLFWLQTFGSATEVPWGHFMTSFGKNYDKEFLDVAIIRNLRTQLLNCGLTDATDPDDQDVSITVEMLDAFVQPGRGLLHTVQDKCDPGTVLLRVGDIYPDRDHHHHDMFERTQILQEQTSLAGEHIVQVACGGRHAMALSSSGVIYTWGGGAYGRLGHGSLVSIPKPKRVEALRGVHCMQISCGFAYSACTTSTGEVYTWGVGENGRLGLGHSFQMHTPSKVTAMEGIFVTGVYAGSVHTCLLTSTGDVYTCGKFEYTGHGTSSDLLVPTLLDDFSGKRVTQISVGPGGYHTIALTNSNDIYTWGHNRVGQLGYHMYDSLPRNFEGAYFLPCPKMIYCHSADGAKEENVRVKQVVAGWGHTAVLSVDGTVYMCGRNEHGQLGLGDTALFPRNERGHHFQPFLVPVQALRPHHITQVACGGEHSLFQTDDNRLFTTGKGNFGQLGQRNFDDYNTPVEMPMMVHRGRNIQQIDCGDAFSFVLVSQFQPPSLINACILSINQSSELLHDIKTATRDEDAIFPMHLLSKLQLPPTPPLITPEEKSSLETQALDLTAEDCATAIAGVSSASLKMESQLDEFDLTV